MGDGERRPPADAEIPSAFATRKANTSTPPPKWRPVDEPPARSYTPILVAVSAAAAIAGVAIVVLALNGYLGPADDTDMTAEVAALRAEIATLQQAQPDQDMAPLRQQVLALEQSVSELTARAPSGGSDAVLTELQGRVAALQEAGATGGSTAALEARLNELGEEVAGLRNAVPGDATSMEASLVPLRQEIEALSARIDRMPNDERVATIETKLNEMSERIGAASALAPAVAADALAAALDSGRPFSSELAALKSLGIDTEAIDGLTPQAGAGLPTLAELRSSFEAALGSVALNPPIPEQAGAIDRLFQSARSLVEVRPVHPTAGSDPAAVIARIRGALEAGDLETALAEWATLPDTIKTPTADWAKQAQARLQADDLAATVRTDALSRLGVGQ